MGSRSTRGCWWLFIPSGTTDTPMPAPTIDSTTKRSFPSIAMRGTNPARAQALTMCVRLLEPGSIAMNGRSRTSRSDTCVALAERVAHRDREQQRLGEQRLDDDVGLGR